MTTIFVTPEMPRSANNYDAAALSDATGLDCKIVIKGEEYNRTKQSFAEEVDINTIVRRFGLTGQIPGDFRAPEFGDFADVADFKTSMDAITLAREAFMQLPAELRFKFANDPQRLMDFVADDNNLDEAAKLGILQPEKVAARRKAAEDAAAAAQAARIAPQPKA